MAITQNEKLERFSAYISPIIEVYGVTAFAARLGVSFDSVRQWAAATQIPYVRTLVAMSDEFSIDLDDLLNAAGKPPRVQTRTRVIEDAHTSLPMMLCAWRDRHGYDSITSAQAFGMARYEFSRLANGSSAIQSIDRAIIVSRVLGVRPESVVEGEFVSVVATATSGAPQMIRDACSAFDLDLTNTTDLLAAAAYTGIGEHRFRTLLDGRETCSFSDAQRLSISFGCDAVALMVASGTDTTLAAKLVAAADEVRSKPRHHLRVEHIGTLLRAHRIVADLSLAEAAGMLGYKHHAALFRTEAGLNQPALETIVLASDVFSIPLDRLLAGTDHVVAQAA